MPDAGCSTEKKRKKSQLTANMRGTMPVSAGGLNVTKGGDAG